MKRWILLLSVVLLISAAPAFAQCAYCDFQENCAFDGTIGGLDCRIFNPGTPQQFCEELGICPNGLASAAVSRSFNADWKVTSVRVLTADNADTARLTDATRPAVAANNPRRRRR